MADPRPVVITMGDPAGIGGEITLRAWNALRGSVPFFVFDDPSRLALLSQNSGIGVPVEPITRPEEAAETGLRALPVLPLPLPTRSVLGLPNPDHAETIVTSIRRAVRIVLDGRASAMVTNPISKAVLYAAGFRHPGHTEFLADLTGRRNPVMMLAAPGLRVVPVTVQHGAAAGTGHAEHRGDRRHCNRDCRRTANGFRSRVPTSGCRRAEPTCG